MTIAISLIVIAIVLIFLFFKNSKERELNISNFLLTIIATFVGVYAGIYLTNLNEVSKKKEKTAKYIVTTQYAIKKHLGLYELLENEYKDSAKSLGLSYIWNKNKHSLPAELLNIISNETNQEMICNETIYQLRQFIDNAETSQSTLGGIQNDSSFVSYIPYVRYWIYRIIDVLNCELEFQQGKIDEDELDNRMQILTDRITNDVKKMTGKK